MRPPRCQRRFHIYVLLRSAVWIAQHGQASCEPISSAVHRERVQNLADVNGTLLRQAAANTGLLVRERRLHETEEESEEVKHASEEGGQKESAQAAEEEKEGEGEGEEEEPEEGEELEPTPADKSIALMLMGGVVLVMFLFIASNLNDPDMRFYVWRVISSTVAIFVSVLLFTTVDSFVHKFLLAGRPRIVQIVGYGAEMVTFISTMQIATASTAGALSERAFDLERTCPTATPRDLKVMLQEEIEMRRLKIRSWCTLLAHMTGFAAIQLGANVQSTAALRSCPLLTFLPCALMAVVLWCLNVVARLSRSRLMHAMSHPTGERAGQLSLCAKTSELDDHGWEMAKAVWEEEIYGAEIDSSALCISFLLVQALRYNISGVMPNALGGEPEHYRHDAKCVAELLVSTFVFMIPTGLMVVLVTKLYPRHHVEDIKSFNQGFSWSIFFAMLGKRCALVATEALAMCIAWCFLFGWQWEFIRIFPHLGSPMSISFRVILALSISGIAFVITLLLDKVADAQCHHDEDFDEMMDTVTYKIISALSISVGFSWEQAFDSGMEIIAELMPLPAHLRQPEIMQCLGVFPLSALVIFAWSSYILQKVNKLECMREEKRVDTTDKKECFREGSEMALVHGHEDFASAPITQRSPC